MNKKLLFLLVCFVILQPNLLQAQEFKIGLKGGINKTFGGELRSYQSTTAELPPATYMAEGEIGFHGGAWAEVGFGKFFIRPEVVYSSLESRFDFPTKSAIYAVDELSIPVVVGYNVWGPLDVYAGGAYKNIIDATLEGVEPPGGGTTPPQVVVQNTPFSAQVGAKVEFGAFGLDVRYDKTLATQESQEVDIIRSVYGVNRANFYDARLNQLIVSLTVKLFDSENAGKRRRRGGNCYF